MSAGVPCAFGCSATVWRPQILWDEVELRWVRLPICSDCWTVVPIELRKR